MGLAERKYLREDDDGPRRPTWRPNPFSAGSWLAIVHVAAFIVCVFNDHANSGPVTYLWMKTGDVIPGLQIWRIATYPLAETNVLAIILTAVCLVFCCRTLELFWSPRRIVLAYIAMTVVGGVFGALFLTVGKSDPLAGATAPFIGLIVAAATRLPTLGVRMPLSNVSVTLKAMTVFILCATVALLLLGSSEYAALPAAIGAGLTGYALARMWKASLRLGGVEGMLREDDGSDSATSNDARPSFIKRWLMRYQALRREREAEADARLDAEVDRILQKVREHGLHSLTPAEQKTLKSATARQQKRHSSGR